ncbi:hypothetical protein Clacol_001590 [Clathrus columnatus]|uniref:Proteasome alpha-type subunits domain-containing protein n=2 Tax=Agaricomycetes TaxID=155619 RepID=A0AAV5A2E4_9AGAM|nr:hypothetical protein Clacol_001590 [Clathrus columnatus]
MCIMYLYQLRQLPYDIEQGLGDFLTPEGLKLIAIDYQQGLLTRLNEQIKGTDLATKSVTDTVIATASDPKAVLAFNYASQALNNSFFLECLQPPPTGPFTVEHNISTFLRSAIHNNFHDLNHFKSTFSAAALGMINSGWVWLVVDEGMNLEVVATFGSGTLLVRSRGHMQSGTLPVIGESIHSRYDGGNSTRAPRIRRENVSPTPSRFTYEHIYDNVGLTPTDQAVAATQGLAPSGNPFEDIGDVLTPLLCISVQEHAWVGTGYGVWGKEEYLKRFWSVVNWRTVSETISRIPRYEFRNTYDSDNTVFSPQGRLHQVEYALEAVKQGSAAVGLRSKTHAILLALKRSTGELASYQQKMFRIDDHIGIAIAGLTSDARVLSNFMRQQAMASRMTFNRPVPVNRLVGSIADKAQVNTQEYGRRPYGVGFLVIGNDHTGPHLYEFSPSGTSYEYFAASIGARSQSAKTYLEKHFEEFADCNLEDLIRHGLYSLRETLQQDKELTIQNTSIGIIGPAGVDEKGGFDGSFRILEGQVIDVYLKSMAPKDTGATTTTSTSTTQAAAPATGGDEDVQMGE